jgi:hypothetical protein
LGATSSWGGFAGSSWRSVVMAACLAVQCSRINVGVV